MISNYYITRAIQGFELTLRIDVFVYMPTQHIFQVKLRADSCRIHEVYQFFAADQDNFKISCSDSCRSLVLISIDTKYFAFSYFAFQVFSSFPVLITQSCAKA